MNKSFIILTVLISFLLTNDCIFAQQSMVPTIKSVNQSDIEWSNTNSWIEKRIPNENDIVEVNGNLLLDKSYTIKSIIINQESSIKNKTGLKPTLTINGDISNYGTIADEVFYLEVAGNIINNGEWKNSITTLIGSKAQIIESKNPIGGTLKLNDKVLTINSPNIAKCNNVEGSVTLNGSGIFYIEGNTSSGTINGTIPEIYFSGTSQSLSAKINIPKVTFSGSSLIYSSLSINGNIVIKENAEITNKSDRKPTLTVNGNITNFGSIGDNTSGSLYIDVSGNIINEGEWDNDITSIIWDAVEMADNYELYTSNSDLTWSTDPILGNFTSYDISSIVNDTIYWKVRASINNQLTDFLDIKSINANAQKIYNFKTIIAIGEYELLLPDASITIAELDIKTSTDRYGNFSIVDIAVGNYEIDIKADGLESIKSNIQISDYQPEMTNVVINLPGWLDNLIMQNMINNFDVDSDAKIGIKEAIHALKCVVGIKN